jgi:hypothetical protein
MKIKINTRKKLIETEGKVNKSDLTKVLNILMPNHKNYRIEESEGFARWEDPIVFNPNIPLRIVSWRDVYNIEA